MNFKARTDEELGDLTYYLLQYDFKIKYSPGRENVKADCLSWNRVLKPEENIEDQLKVVNLITLEDIVIDQNKIKEIQRNKQNNWKT